MLKYLYFYITCFLFSFYNISPVNAADLIAPVSTFIIDPAFPNGENGWYTVRPEVTITASDDSSGGVKSISYRINDGSWQTVISFSGLNLILNPSYEYGYISD